MQLRRAVNSDLQFLAWSMLAASRGDRPRGFWDQCVVGSEVELLSFLTALASRPGPAFPSFNNFLVVDEREVPIGAGCGYFANKQGAQVFWKNLAAALTDCSELGKREDQNVTARLLNYFKTAPRFSDGAWVLESLATALNQRGRGVASRLLQGLLEEGKSRGAKRAQLLCLNSNLAAIELYLKHGFRITGSRAAPKRCEDWVALVRLDLNY